MTDKYNPPACNASVPVYVVHETDANAAYEAHAALQMTARSNPRLLDNPYFAALQDTAFARFLATFKVL